MWQRAPWWWMAWLLGTVLQLQQAQLWTLAWVWGAAIVGLLAMVVSHGACHHKRYHLRFPLHRAAAQLVFFCGLTLLALAFVNGRCWLQAQDALALNLEGQDLQLTVEVGSLPHVNDQGVRFLAQVVSAQTVATQQVVKVPEWLELSWSEWDAPSILDLPVWQSLTPGDQWQFQVRLKLPHGSMNPGGFDEELRLWELGVMATGSIRVGKQAIAPQKLSSSWHHPVDQLRQRVRAQVVNSLALADTRSAHSAGVIAALVMGDQAAIAPADWQTFRATGVAHLMSISGLHITMLAWLTSWLVALIWRGTARWESPLCSHWPAPWVGAVGGLSVAMLYAIFCGWGLPAQRTLLMLSAMVFLKWRGLHWPWHWVWAFALGLVVMWDPWSLLQASFWLSFVAVGALILAGSSASHYRTKLVDKNAEMVQSGAGEELRLILGTRLAQGARALVREQGVVTLALFPLSVLFFGQLSLSGLLANLIAIPWVTFCVTPLALLGLVWHPLWQVASAALEPLMIFLNWLAAWPEGVLSFTQAPLALTVIAMVGALWSLQNWPWWLRLWGLLWLLPVVLWQTKPPQAGQFELWALDIGQGNAVVVRTAHHVLLYDTGPAWRESADAGQRMIVPFLARMGLRLDRLILSHRDADHTGGAASVLAAHPQADLWTSIETGHPLTQNRELVRCKAGQRWVWDGVQFEMLHPKTADYAQSKSSNALSCVLRVAASQGQIFNSQKDHTVGSVLLVGDIEAAEEASLLQANLLTPVDFLLVPHHGSQTSSTSEFVQTVKPGWAMVQSGYRNRYGHPVPQVLARYEQIGVRVRSSPACGAAHWQSDAPNQLDCERDVRRRYWQYTGPSAHVK
jgi:competence protein ComEC